MSTCTRRLLLHCVAGVRHMRHIVQRVYIMHHVYTVQLSRHLWQVHAEEEALRMCVLRRLVGGQP